MVEKQEDQAYYEKLLSLVIWRLVPPGQPVTFQAADGAAWMADMERERLTLFVVDAGDSITLRICPIDEAERVVAQGQAAAATKQ